MRRFAAGTLALLLLAPIVAPAEALGASGVDGVYTGHVDQKVPGAYTGKIRLTVRHGAVTKLSFKVATMCNDGAMIFWAPTSPTGFHIKVHRSGSFAYDKTLPVGRVQLKGKLQHGKATGMLFGWVKTAHGECSMYESAPFTAHR
jgi:hypothetical protein